MDYGRERTTEDMEPLTPDGKISRRAMVAGTVATTAMAFLPLSHLAFAQVPKIPDTDMMAFLVLSEALTGVEIHTLAPEFSQGPGVNILNADPGTDPFNIKNDYFNKAAAAALFTNLLKIAKDNSPSRTNILAKVNASDADTKFLARSIVLLWYLGTWYDPGDLKSAPTSPELAHGPIQQKVLTPTAYTQGLVWQIVGAHPMGYSNLQFGYWSRDPHDLNGPTDQPLPLFNPATP